METVKAYVQEGHKLNRNKVSITTKTSTLNYQTRKLVINWCNYKLFWCHSKYFRYNKNQTCTMLRRVSYLWTLFICKKLSNYHFKVHNVGFVTFLRDQEFPISLRKKKKFKLKKKKNKNQYFNILHLTRLG